MAQQRKKRRTNAFEVRIATGGANEPRSRVWKLWVPRGKNDAYLTPSSPGLKASFHDPAESRTRPPFHLALSVDHAPEPEFRVAPNQRYMVEWGPLGDLGSGAFPLAQVIIPGSELRAPLGDESEQRVDVRWLTAPMEGEAAFISIYSLPPQPEEVKWAGPPSGTVHFSVCHTLGTGRILVVMGSVSAMAPGLTELVADHKARFRDGLYRSLADGTAPALDPGPTTMDGVLPISAGRVQAFVDLHLESFAVLPGVTSAE